MSDDFNRAIIDFHEVRNVGFKLDRLNRLKSVVAVGAIHELPLLLLLIFWARLKFNVRSSLILASQ